MVDIEVRKIDNVWLDIQTEHEGILYELRDYFQFVVPNYKFMPAYQNGWDGKIKLFNPFKRRLYVGLLPYLKKFAQQFDYKILVDRDLEPAKIMTPEQVNDFCQALEIFDEDGKQIKPRFHQKLSLYHTINLKRAVLVAPTAGGKSMMPYLFSVWALQHQLKTLIIVPTTGLVEQLAKDFCDYSQQKIKDQVHKIYQGKEKISGRGIFISTWQSLYKLPKDYFNQFDAMMVDECHGTDAKSMIQILEKAENCEYRIGYTGTMKDPKAHKWVIEGLLGTTIDLVTMKEMKDRGWISESKINCLVLNHPKKDYKKREFKEEIDFLVENEVRNQKICKLISSVKGNSFVLFERVQHGKRLHEILVEQNPDRRVELVYGDTDTEIREEIRMDLADEDNAIVIASYKVFSTGISVRNLHHVFFAGPLGKSKMRLFQSIGRALRIHEGKKMAYIWDIADKLSQEKFKPNHGLRHFSERVKMYNHNELNYEIKSYNL